MNRLELIERAVAVVGHGCHYKLGEGGRLWHRATPWNPQMLCDCTGYLSWCYGVDRHTDDPWYRNQNGGWIESTAIVRDCETPFGAFTGVPWQQALPGDTVVYGDRDGHQGHVGLVVKVDEMGPAEVVHCSTGNDRRTGDAIAVTGADLWQTRGGIVARSKWVEA